jgi:hypothetical protein
MEALEHKYQQAAPLVVVLVVVVVVVVETPVQGAQPAQLDQSHL